MFLLVLGPLAITIVARVPRAALPSAPAAAVGPRIYKGAHTWWMVQKLRIHVPAWQKQKTTPPNENACTSITTHRARVTSSRTYQGAVSVRRYGYGNGRRDSVNIRNPDKKPAAALGRLQAEQAYTKERWRLFYSDYHSCRGVPGTLETLWLIACCRSSRVLRILQPFQT